MSLLLVVCLVLLVVCLVLLVVCLVLLVVAVGSGTHDVFCLAFLSLFYFCSVFLASVSFRGFVWLDFLLGWVLVVW